MKGEIEMTLEMAKAIIGQQEKNLRKVNNLRFIKNGYEYKIVYEGGFADFIGIYRREIGKRNFKFFHGIGGYKFWNLNQVMKEIEKMVESKG